nr:hypothetical protein [Aquicoccus sp. G2-2]MEA1113345.1 hypothetical protein [Aquicoccus sp. G2-2]
MVGGFLKGVLLGGIVAVGGAVGLSLISGGPVMHGVDRTPPEVASASVKLETPPGAQEAGTVAAKATDTPVEMQMPDAPAQASKPDGVPVPDLSSDTGQVPQTGEAQVAMAAPETGEQVPGVSAAGDTPVTAPSGEPAVPVVPKAEASPDVSVQPAAKPAPGTAPVLAQPEDAADINPDADKRQSLNTLEELVIKVTPDAPQAPVAPGLAPDQPQAAPDAPQSEAEAQATEAEPGADPEADAGMQTATEDAAPDPVREAEAAEPMPPAPVARPERIAPEEGRVQIGTPAKRLGRPALSLGNSGGILGQVRGPVREAVWTTTRLRAGSRWWASPNRAPHCHG